MQVREVRQKRTQIWDSPVHDTRIDRALSSKSGIFTYFADGAALRVDFGRSHLQ